MKASGYLRLSLFMDLFTWFITFLQTASLGQVFGFIVVINIFQVIFVTVVGDWLVIRYSHPSVSEAPAKLTKIEIALVFLTLMLNSGITLLGYAFWLNGFIVITNGSFICMLIDMVIFILFIDLSMYLLHRVAHWDKLFPWLHSTHHNYANPRPITLFVLNPMETLSFGALWLIILVLYHSSWPGVFLFLTFNLLFGMIGHLGVEPLGNSIFRKYYVKRFSTSTFHAMHHKTDKYNYGFYLVLWDRILRTLHPAYFQSFEHQMH